jgi:hypothetical protein
LLFSASSIPGKENVFTWRLKAVLEIAYDLSFSTGKFAGSVIDQVGKKFH